MMKIYKNIILLITFLSFFVSSIPFVEAGEGDVCKQVKIDKKTSLAASSTQSSDLNSTTNSILPVHSVITIHIPKAANNNVFTQNIAYKYGLYATSGGGSGWVFSNNNSLLAATENSEEISFTINTATLFENENGKEQTSIIPKTDDRANWKDPGTITFKIPQRAGSLEKQEGLPTLCTFTLNVSNQCSAYPGFSLNTLESALVLKFGKSNSFFEGSQSHHFQFSRGINDTTRTTVPRDFVYSDAYRFGINKTEAPDYFTGSTPVILHRGEIPICETFFVPDNSDFQKSRGSCSITPDKVGDSFSGNLKIQDIPNIMLDATGKKWVNVAKSETEGHSAGLIENVIPKIVVVPTNIFQSYTTNSTPISGIQTISSRDMNNTCSDSTNCLFVPPPGGISVLPPLTRDVDYTAFVVFQARYYRSVMVPGSLPSVVADVTSYYLIPQCSYKFYWGKDGFEDKGKIEDEPTLAPGEEAPPPPELKQICESIPPGSESRANCDYCMSQESKSYTALGCIPTDFGAFLKDYMFTIGLGFAGGIAFLLMLWGGFNILISQGDAHKIQMGREIIVSAGIGLIFIIFAIVILQVIGKDILQLPFFGAE